MMFKKFKTVIFSKFDNKCSVCAKPMKLHLVKCPSCDQMNINWERFFFLGKVIGVIVAVLTLCTFIGSYISNLKHEPKPVTVSVSGSPLRFSFLNNDEKATSISEITVQTFHEDWEFNKRPGVTSENEYITVRVPIRMEQQYTNELKGSLPTLMPTQQHTVTIVPELQFDGGVDELRNKQKELSAAYNLLLSPENGITLNKIRDYFYHPIKFCNNSSQLMRIGLVKKYSDIVIKLTFYQPVMI